MAVKLRLRREGTTKRPHYRIVAADHRAPVNGRFIEILGEYHPLDDPSTVTVDRDRALYWLGVGAQPSSQVKKLLRLEGVWEEFKPDDAPRRERTAKAVERARKAREEADEPVVTPPQSESPAEADTEAAADDTSDAAPDDEAASDEAETADESTDETDSDTTAAVETDDETDQQSDDETKDQA